MLKHDCTAYQARYVQCTSRDGCRGTCTSYPVASGTASHLMVSDTGGQGGGSGTLRKRSEVVVAEIPLIPHPNKPHKCHFVQILAQRGFKNSPQGKKQYPQGATRACRGLPTHQLADVNRVEKATKESIITQACPCSHQAIMGSSFQGF